MAEVSRSSTQRVPGSGWSRLLMPSAGDLIFMVLLGMLLFTGLSVRLLGDAGIGWHIRTGQEILATHVVPRVDHFSSTMSGKPWFAWEWLYDLIVGQLEASLGLNGVVWLTAIVTAIVLAAAFRLMLVRGASVCVAVGLVLLVVSASMIHLFARPHIFSWLFTLAWFWVLDRSESQRGTDRASWKRRWLLWTLPPSMLLWVNLHGGFLLGFVLLGIFWVSALWQWLTTAENSVDDLLLKMAARTRVQDLTAVGLLSAAATFVNPYGWKLHAHIYSYLSNRFLMDHIDEFQSPNFHGAAQKCFAVLILIAFVAMATRVRAVPMSEGLIVLFAVYSGLIASRNIPVSAILLALIAGPILTGVFEQISAKRRSPATSPRFLSRLDRTERSLHGHLWPVLAVIATLAVAANGGRIGASTLIDAHFSPKRMPVAAVDYLQAHEIAGPVFAPDYWSGYLIYRMYPKAQVVVDDRHDLYGDEFFKSYLRAIHVEAGWDDFLRQHTPSCLLLPVGSPLANMLEAKGGWKVVYADDVAIAFVSDSREH